MPLDRAKDENAKHSRLVTNDCLCLSRKAWNTASRTLGAPSYLVSKYTVNKTKRCWLNASMLRVTFLKAVSGSVVRAV